MSVLIDELLQQPGAWLQAGADSSIVVSSRIRLARNLKGYAFPGWAGAEECERIWRHVAAILSALKGLQECIELHMGDLGELDRQVLF